MIMQERIRIRNMVLNDWRIYAKNRKEKVKPQT